MEEDKSVLNEQESIEKPIDNKQNNEEQKQQDNDNKKTLMN